MFNRNANLNMYSLSNELDRAVGSLVEDLKTPGDFDRTLIVMMGEFGRTPGALNVQGGRDHHKNAMSVVMMGGGVAGNRGRSSRPMKSWSAWPQSILRPNYSTVGG